MSGIPPIVATAQRLLAECERAVPTFARRYRYEFGADLRRDVRKAVQLTLRAWRDGARRGLWIDRLVWMVDDVKASLQVGADIRAFASRAQFEHIIRIAAELGRQAGGWKRQASGQQNPQGQNAAPSRQPQRAKTLSTRAASTGATR